MSSTPEMPLLNMIAARMTSADETMSFQSMATLISPTIAITPDYVFQPFDRESLRTDIKVKLHFEARTDIPNEVEATLIARDPEVHFAILQLKPGFAVNLPDEILSFDLPPRDSTWQSWFITPGTPKGIEVNGTIIGLDGRQHLHLKLSRSPERSDSGAPIVVNNRVVGIIVRRSEHERDWHGIPVTAMLNSRITPNLKSLLAEAPPNTGKLNVTNADDTLKAEGKTTPDDATLYQKLSPSSKRAFNHADGLRISLERDVVHMEQLLAGLFEKKDGPTQRVLEDAGIDWEQLHQLLEEEAERDFPQRDQYTPSELTALPLLSAHVREALLAANAAADTHGAKQIQSRHLIYGALSITHCGMIKRLLALNVDKDKIDLTPDKSPDPNAPQIAGYQSDAPADQDLLGITHEVQALCAVLSAKDVQPPLSLGLFGEWGSGKSSFMRQMELQINANREDARTNPDSPYCRDVVQLWFNAWHYIDVDLWATLAQKIFDDLKESLKVQAIQKKPEDVEYERANLLTKSLQAKAELTTAQEAQQKTEIAIQQTETQLAAVSKGEELKLGLLDALDEVARLKSAEEKDKEKDKAAPAAEKTEKKDTEEEKKKQDEQTKKAEIANNIQKAATTLSTDEEKVKEELLEVQGLWLQARALWLAVQYDKDRRRKLCLTLLAVVVAIGGLVLWGVVKSRPEWYAVVLALGASITPLWSFVRTAHRAVKFVNEALKSSRQMREKELQEQRSRLKQQLEEQQKNVQQKTAEVDQYDKELEALRPDKQIERFVNQRSASNDYSQYRGVIARVRDDFNQLSTLLANERAMRDQKQNPLKEEEALLPRIDRIILYIDDLDRCPENKVVEVLQAVHLLLAFPLFVVVVGVDPRWLLHSLKQHSAAFRATMKEEDGLSDEESTHWQSTPMNYLEKIFQIPFTLRPMAEPGFQELIEKLAAAPPAKTSVPPADKPADEAKPEEIAPSEPARDLQPEPPIEPVSESPEPMEPEPSPPVEQSREELEKSPPPTIINPEYLRIEDWEREVMKQLYGLIPSPRAAKRFVNIYRLLRVSVAADKRAAFISQENPEQHRAALLLLAMLIGYPSETTDILRQLHRCTPDKKWWEFWGTVKPEPQGTGVVPGSPQAAEEKNWQDLKKKLDHKDVRALIPAEQSCEHFITWANEVARYSFQSGRVLLG